MAIWTDELKQQVIDTYLGSNPTAENSGELIKEIADDVGQSANGVRQILVLAKVYVKKEVATATTTTTKTTKSTGDGEKRVSKESQLTALREAIEAKGGDIDEDILAKLTGKAAAYFTAVLTGK